MLRFVKHHNIEVGTLQNNSVETNYKKNATRCAPVAVIPTSIRALQACARNITSFGEIVFFFFVSANLEEKETKRA